MKITARGRVGMKIFCSRTVCMKIILLEDVSA